MGLSEDCLYPLGGTTFHSNNSSKEADSAFKPISRTQRTDWPTIVFESGLSKSLTHLRQDAQWWLNNSGGDVNIVIIISIALAVKRLRIEKWCLLPATGQMPATRTRQNPNPLVPTNVQDVTITQNPTARPNTAAQPNTTAQPNIAAQPGGTIQPGPAPSYTATGPLTLEFQSVFLRAPVPLESDVVFTVADLERWAGFFWGCVK